LVAEVASGGAPAPRRLRVLYLTNMWPDAERPWYGGFVQTEADALRRLGVDLHVLVIRGYAGRSAYARAAGRIAALNRRSDFDVVHATYGHTGVVARLYLRAPLVLTYVGSDLLGERTHTGTLTRRSRLERAVFRRLPHVAAATIVVSDQLACALPRACRPRLRVIPHGVDLERFTPIARDVARRELGWRPDEKAVLFVGDPRLPVKNHALAQSVCRHVATEVPGVTLRVAATRPREEIPLWMSAADALLVTSRSEGSPTVVKEAMACELPIVSTPVGDVAERLHGLPGCHIAPPESDALAAALVGALRHGRVPEARAAIAPLDARLLARRAAAVYEQVAA
jgi:glycosyltransferase involved in cell wall biosynthesis